MTTPAIPRVGLLATVRNRHGVVAAVQPFDGEGGACTSSIWNTEKRRKTRPPHPALLPNRFALAGTAQVFPVAVEVRLAGP